jgi:hypothetical protein
LPAEQLREAKLLYLKKDFFWEEITRGFDGKPHQAEELLESCLNVIKEDKTEKRGC